MAAPHCEEMESTEAEEEKASYLATGSAIRRMRFSELEAPAMYVLDDKDRALLAALQRDSRQTVQQLAAAVGLSTTPCWKRVKDMEAAGGPRGHRGGGGPREGRARGW